MSKKVKIICDDMEYNLEMVDDKNSSVYGMTKSVTITFIEDREV